MRSPRNELEDDLRDDRQRALRTDEELREVVASHVLVELPAGVDECAVGENSLQSHHEVFRDPVLHSARSASVFGNVAYESACPARRGIGRIEEAELLDLFLKNLRDDSGLHDTHEVFLINLQDLVHAMAGQED